MVLGRSKKLFTAVSLIYFVLLLFDGNFILNFILGLKYPASNAIYEETNCFTEKITKILNTCPITIFYLTIMIPILVFNFHTYFTTDSGNDAFQMFFPYW